MSLVPFVLCLFVKWSLTHGRPIYLFPQFNPLWSVARSCWPGFCGVQNRCQLRTAVLISLLSAIGLTYDDSSTVHIYTQTIHRTTQ